MRSLEGTYNLGEAVYYKRYIDRGEWQGKSTVLGNRGPVYFIEHQGDLMRVAACKLVKIEGA